MSTDVAVREPQTLAVRYELEVEDLINQVQKIQHLMAKVMKDGEHFGVIPGTGTKPTLLKPGAEKLCLMFRLAPDPHSVDVFDGKHLTIKARCDLYHIPTGQKWGSGEGSCSTKESKYAYRKADRSCPSCQNHTIRRSKDGGWFCWKKLGGCGRTFQEGTASIEKQAEGRVPNEDVADQYNTVLKMANKRALVAAVLNVTAASDIFTQDLEDTAVEPPATPLDRIIEPEMRRLAETPLPRIPDPIPDQNEQDRSSLVHHINELSALLGWSAAKQAVNWAKFIGPNVKEEHADIGKLAKLEHSLATELQKREKGAAEDVPVLTAYIDFCAAHGLNAWHPRTWTPEQVALHAAWKLANYKAKWSAYKAQRIASWMPTEIIRERVRHSVQALRAPAPSRPWKVCPCHAPVWDQGTGETVQHGLEFIRRFRRGA